VDLYNALGTSLINITEEGFDNDNGDHVYLKNRLVQVAKTSVVTNDEMMYIPGAKLKMRDGALLPRQIQKTHHSHKQAMKAFEKFPLSRHRDWKENWDKEAYAKVLTDETFDEAMKTHDFVMVNYHAPWCPWCTRLKPAWEHAAGIVQKTTVSPGGDSKNWHGFDTRDDAMYAWEEHNEKNAESPATLVEFLDMKRKEKGLTPVDDLFEEGQPKALLAKVDCTQQQRLCMRQNIMGFPTIRIHTDRKVQSFREYEGDRSSQDLVKYVHENLPELNGFTQEEETEALEAQKKTKTMTAARESELTASMEKRITENGDSHGCNIIGTIKVQKVPGTLVLGAHSNDRSMVVDVLNMSHIVHHLAVRSYNDPMLAELGDHDEYVEDFEEHVDNAGKKADDFGVFARRIMRNHKGILETGLASYGMGNISPFLFPLNGKRFSSSNLRGMLAHYVKVVHTFILPKGQTEGLSESSEIGGFFAGWGYDHMEVYQHQVHSSTDATLKRGGQNSLNITYDISPLAYELTTKTSDTATFLTQLCAIIGGVFTVVGMVDNVIYNGAAGLHSMMK